MLGSALGSLFSASTALSGAIDNARLQNAAYAANQQNASLYNVHELDRIRRLQNAGYNVGYAPRMTTYSTAQNVSAPVATPKPNWAATVELSDHEKELMRLDENLSELRRQNDERQADIVARMFSYEGEK